MLYPLKLAPVYKDYLWGGRTLSRFGKKLPGEGIVAESWEISCHPNGVSVISNGVLAGMPLPDAIGRFGRDLLGNSLPDSAIRKFPLLIKFFDANDSLSIQVHPDDAFAGLHENGESGKNEMWYIVEAQPGAFLYAGLRPGITRGQLSEALASGNPLDCFQKLAVKPGDVINIPAGLVHATGKGLLIYEIQQSSDVTYRLYDFGRRDARGRERPLHLEKGLAAIDERMSGQSALTGLTFRDPKRPDLVSRVMVLNRFFLVEELTLRGQADFLADGSRFMTLTAIAGEGRIEYAEPENRQGLPPFHGADGPAMDLTQGESVLIPACLGPWRLTGDLKLIAGQVSDFAADLQTIARRAGLGENNPVRDLLESWSGKIGFAPVPDALMNDGDGAC